MAGETQTAPVVSNESYYRARYYDPGTGRFLSEDPPHFKVGINFYRYVANNSVNLTDPFGLQPDPGCGCKVAAGAIAGGAIGAVAGRWLGGILGGAGGALFGTLAEPGGGTVVGGVAGAVGGAAVVSNVGSVAGAVVGGLVGAIAAKYSCSVLCYLNTEYKDPSYDPKFKLCSYSCSDGSVRVRVIHIFLPCPLRWDGN